MLIYNLASLALVSALPLHRRVTLDAAATAEAQKVDNTATRAFTGIPIKTSDGKCLNVVSGSGDFRNNLTPVTAQTCDNSKGQQWDVITKGVHNDQAGFALIVSSLTNACANFDSRRQPGNQVLLFSCGGRADGEGQVTDSQLFTFNGGSGPFPLVPKSGDNKTCLTIKGNNLDQSDCDPAAASGAELFTFGNGGGAAAKAPAAAAPAGAAADKGADAKATKQTQGAASPAAAAPAAPPTQATTNSAVKTGVKLDDKATAEAQQKDTTATRALTGVPIKAPDGSCLFVDKTSGDFRENLIPIQTGKCDGSAAQQWDVITKGKHNNVVGQALIVSSLTQGCMNFDDRRQPGNQVLLFSCGGRADGEGQVTDSQLFSFNGGDAKKPIALTPKNAQGAKCFDVAQNGLLDVSSCDSTKPGKNQLFTIG